MSPTDGLDRASTLTELLALDGVDERCEIRPQEGVHVGVMAYHGGALEEMTDVIAERVAEQAGVSYYGIIQPMRTRRHLASTKVRPAESAALAGFLDDVDIVATIHGFGRRGMFSSLLLGGSNRDFAEHVGAALRRTLPAYDVVTDLERIPSALRGVHPDNPVNLPRDGGVQVELPPRVRGSSPLWWDWEGPGLTPNTDRLIDGLVDALASWT
ncbi:MAG: poly-gamma-glutamate hydrolase family protein [Actinomycetota bacterium]